MRGLKNINPFLAPDEGGGGGSGELDIDNLPDDHTVPVSVLKALRTDLQGKLKSFEDKMAEKDDELLLYKTAMRTSSPAGNGAPAQTVQVNPLESFFKDRDPDEPVTISEIKALANQMNAQSAEQATLGQVASQPDFQDIVYKHLPNVLKSQPHLANVIRSLPTQAAQYALAYQLGKTDPEYLAKSITGKKTEVHDDAKAALENAQKPKSPSSLGQSGSVATDLAEKIKSAVPGTPEFRKLQADMRRGRS